MTNDSIRPRIRFVVIILLLYSAMLLSIACTIIYTVERVCVNDQSLWHMVHACVHAQLLFAKKTPGYRMLTHP